MRTMNLDPFWRTSIGFDRLFDLMDESLRFEPEDHYPPCNIVRTGENTYRISLAVAGFKPEQVNVTVNQNSLSFPLLRTTRKIKVNTFIAASQAARLNGGSILQITYS